MSKYLKAASLLGVPTIEEQDGGVFLASDQMAQIDAQLSSTEELRNQLEQAQTAQTAAEQARDAAQAQVNTLTEENTQLKQKAAAPPTPVSKKKDGLGTEVETAATEIPVSAETEARARVASFSWTDPIEDEA